MANGKHSRLGALTNMLHKAKGKIKTAEHRGYNKAIEVVESLSVWNRIKFLFSPTVLRACKSLK